MLVAGGTWPELLDAMRLRPLLCYLAVAACYEDPGDLYDILEISPLANPQEVKKAYRRKSSTEPPDKGGTAARLLRHRVPADPGQRWNYQVPGDLDPRNHKSHH